MRRKKVKDESNNDAHRWVVSYADFITLLFAFFVVMYAISSLNVSKYRSVAEGMKVAFDKNGKDKAANKDPNNKGDEATYSSDKIIQGGGGSDDFDALQSAFRALSAKNLNVLKQEGFLQLDLKAENMFDTGSADLKQEAMVQMMKIATILNKVNYPIIVEGYTDDIPISTPNFPSNWELSTLRASAIARALNNFGVPNDRMTVTGYGEQYPIADNDTEVGRAMNRRVNIVIVRDRLTPRIMNPALSKPLF